VPDAATRTHEVEQALQRLLEWPEIARSPQLAGFLDYIVRRTLAGDPQSIKAYSIAVDVLGRPPDFDPQADPIVRVQARRLRALLEQFYRGPGAGETVRIALPVGRYVPEFVEVEPSDADSPPPENRDPEARQIVGALAPPRRGHVTVSWFVLAVIALGAAVLAYALSTWGPRQEQSARAAGLMPQPAVTVVEFQNLTGAADDLRHAAGLAIELVTDLEQFETMTVRYGGSGDINAAVAGGADFVLSGIVRREGDTLQYSAILTDVVRAGTVWNKAIALGPDEAGRGEVLDGVSDALSRVLGSPRGPVHAGARRLLLEGGAIAGGENLYLCRMLFDLYRESESYAMAERANACFAALGARERASGQALAATASLTAEFAANAGASVASQADRFRIAGELLRQALVAAPLSGFVWEQLARLEEARGAPEAAIAAYASALQLNPASTDAMAAQARFLAFIGRLDDAIPLAATAIDAAPDTPPWYLGVPTLAALREGQYAAAIEYAEIYADADRELGPVLAIMAAQGLGDGDAVNRHLPRVLETPTFRAYGVLNQLRRRIGDEALLERVRDALLAAGVPPQSLLRPF